MTNRRELTPFRLDKRESSRRLRVLATGTFDILHPGHLTYLEEGRKLGDELWVIVARDIHVKHKPPPVMSEEHRLRMVAALKGVDKAILGSSKDIFEFLPEIRPDVIALGPDQHFDEKWLETELEKRGLRARVVRIRAVESHILASSSALTARLAERFQPELRQMAGVAGRLGKVRNPAARRLATSIALELIGTGLSEKVEARDGALLFWYRSRPFLELRPAGTFVEVTFRPAFGAVFRERETLPGYRPAAPSPRGGFRGARFRISREGELPAFRRMVRRSVRSAASHGSEKVRS